MGNILTSYFDKAKKKGGITAQVKLAMITKMSFKTAEEAEDSEENETIFINALEQI